MKKTVIITGGVRGIGLGIAKAFLQKDYDVHVTYSKDEKNAKLCQTLGLKVHKTDVTCEEEVKALFQQINKVDILVNNAGVALVKQIQDTTYDEWMRLFKTNVGGAFLCSREAVRYMLSNQQGLIVNISSVWGEVGASCESVYASTKSALIGFTKSLAKELGYSGIRVNTISPGIIDTKMNTCFDKKDLDMLLQDVPAGRMGLPCDIAKAVLFLEENDYVTGIDLPVNGGFSIV